LNSAKLYELFIWFIELIGENKVISIGKIILYISNGVYKWGGNDKKYSEEYIS
jgi:hypothetical protein